MTLLDKINAMKMPFAELKGVTDRILKMIGGLSQ